MRNCESFICGALIGAAVLYALTKDKSARPKRPPKPLPPPCGCGRYEPPERKPAKRDCFYGIYERC